MDLEKNEPRMSCVLFPSALMSVVKGMNNFSLNYIFINTWILSEMSLGQCLSRSLSGRFSPRPDFVLCVVACPGIQTDSVLSARLQIIRIYIREDGRLVIEFKTHAKFRGNFCMFFFPTSLFKNTLNIQKSQR